MRMKQKPKDNLLDAVSESERRIGYLRGRIEEALGEADETIDQLSKAAGSIRNATCVYGDAHPMQPVVTDDHGTKRFKANSIVQWLLDEGGKDMNEIVNRACGRRTPSFPNEDLVQFYQLIGYSLGAFGGLSEVPKSVVDVVDELLFEGES